MDSCLGVEQDLERALTKFKGLGEHTDRVIAETIVNIENLRQEIAESKSLNHLNQSCHKLNIQC